MNSVFKNIRAECARNSISIEELSNKIGIERKTFYNWESKKDFPVSYLVKMSNIFHVAPDVLLGIQPNATDTSTGSEG